MPGVGLAHADTEIALARGNLWQDQLPSPLAAVLEDLRAGLPIRDPMRAARCAGRQHLLGYDEALQVGVLAATIPLRPGHADETGEAICALFLIAMIITRRRQSLSRGNSAGEAGHYQLNTGSEGIEIRPIMNVSGGHEFNEVFFKSCFVPDDMMIGKPGEGWTRVTGELAFERAGPDRFMSDIRLLVELVDKVGREPNERQAVEIGRLASHFATLRRMSSSIAGLLERGESPETEAALVKDVGTAFEREVPEMVRKLLPIEASLDDDDEYSQAMAHVLLHAPSFTIRGGTPEILRGMIARGLGLR